MKIIANKFMKIKINIKDKSYDVEISQAKEGEVKIRVGEKEFSFNEGDVPASAGEKRKPTVAQAYLSEKKDFGETEIKSPLAGIISEIFVEIGAEVKKGDKVVLLSAMKMENEIISEFQGKVKEIKIKKNQQVKNKEVLIVLA